MIETQFSSMIANLISGVLFSIVFIVLKSINLNKIVLDNIVQIKQKKKQSR